MIAKKMSADRPARDCFWTQESSPFWKQRDFATPASDAIKRLPADFPSAEGDWLTLQLKDEVAIELSLDKEFAVFRESERERTERMMDQAKLPGSKVLEDRFMVIEQAMGMPRGRDAGLQYAKEFIEDVKASGFVARSLEKSGVRGVPVAPPEKP